MCLSPVSILNNRRVFRPQLDKMYNLVPCGHCPECLDRKHNDWYIRLFYEWKRYKKIGGCTYFLTLSYNRAQLPCIDLSDEIYSCLDYLASVYGFTDDNTHTLYPAKFDCFSKKDIKDFVKRFRTILADVKNITDGCKYFVVCEYGGTYHRPHYHLIWFSPKPIHNVDTDPEALEVLDLAHRAWADRVKYVDCPDFVQRDIDYYSTIEDFTIKEERYALDTDHWYFVKDSNPIRKKPIAMHYKGFVMKSEKWGLIVKNPQGMRYLTEYLEKDSEYMSIELRDNKHNFIYNEGNIVTIQDLYDFLGCCPSIECLTSMEQNGLRNAIINLKNVFPFHLQSQLIGNDLYEELNIEDVTNVLPEYQAEYVAEKRKLLIENVVHIDGDDKAYQIPQYIINRLFYHYEKNPFTHKVEWRTLTPIGYDVLSIKYKQQLEYYQKLYTNFDKVYLPLLNCLEVEELKRTFGIDPKTFFQYFKQTIGIDGIFSNLTAFINYRIFLQNVSTYAYKEDFLCTVLDMRNTPTFGEIFLQEKLVTHDEKRGQSLQQLDRCVIEDFKQQFFNDLSEFANYDFFLSYFDRIRYLISMRIFKQTNESKKVVQSLKNYLNHFVYVQKSLP